MTKQTSLLPLIRSYFERDPTQAARSLETMKDEEAREVLKALPPNLTVKVFPYLQINYAANLLEEIPEELFKEIVGKLEPKQGAALFMHLPKDFRTRLLDVLPEKLKKQIAELLSYPEDSAGRIMSTNFLAFHVDQKVKDVIQKIRLLTQKGFPGSYAYVVDEHEVLVGVINMRDLMLAGGDASLESVMRKEVFKVHGFADREKVANELSMRKFFAAPVVDIENKLLGVVRAEQLIEDMKEEVAEDIQKMVGVGGNEQAFSPSFFSLKKRVPWLYVNLATAFLAASVVALFESIIAKITILAIFLPVVAGQGGNAGAQSLAVVMRGIVMREIPKEKIRKFIFKEAGIGLANGILIGIVTALIAWLWQGNPMLGVVIGLAMIVNLCVAGLSGAAIPLTMKRIGLDPAQSSSIILTTVTDVVGFFAFLGFAVLFQQFLL